MPPEARAASPSGPSRWLLLFGVWLCYASFGLVATSLAPLVPVIEADLGLRHAAMGTVLGAWQLVYVFAAVPCGLLLDRIGPRHALLLGGALIALSAVGRSQATSFAELFGAVMLFGLGGPIVSAGAPKVVTHLFEGSDRGLAMGIYMTGPALGGVTSLTLTHSVLLPAFDGSWRVVLLLWGGFAIAAAVFWWGLAAGHSFADEEAPARAPDRPRPSQIATLRSLLRIPAVRVLLVMAVGAFSFNHGLNNWLPELLRAGGLGLVEAGYWAAVPTVVGIGSSLLIPRLATPERRHAILMGLCLSALGASLLLQTSQPATLVPGLFLQGVVRASLMTVLILTLVELPEIGNQRAGAASGLFFSAAEVGGVLGPLGMGLLYDTSGTFAPGLLTLSAITAGLALATLRLRRHAGPRVR